MARTAPLFSGCYVLYCSSCCLPVLTKTTLKKRFVISMVKQRLDCIWVLWCRSKEHIFVSCQCQVQALHTCPSSMISTPVCHLVASAYKSSVLAGSRVYSWSMYAACFNLCVAIPTCILNKILISTLPACPEYCAVKLNQDSVLSDWRRTPGVWHEKAVLPTSWNMISSINEHIHLWNRCSVLMEVSGLRHITTTS